MINIGDIFDFLNLKAPCGYRMDFDNVGLLIGNRERAVKKVLLALEITDEVISEAIDINAELIVSHHPVFFSLKSVSTDTPEGKKALKMAENKIAAICMHTNLDAVKGGVNDELAKIAGLTDIEPLDVSGRDEEGNCYGIGRVGKLSEEISLNEYLSFLKKALKANGLRYFNAGRPVKLVAVGGGSCGDYLEKAFNKGCDTFLTADIKYDTFLNAKRMGINLIDGDHFCTENVVMPVLKRWLTEEFSSLEIQLSQVHKQTVSFC